MILITGASGNVGSEVLKQAAAAGLKIRAAYQTADKAAQAPAGVETVLVDFSKSATLPSAVKGVETLFLVGPPTPNLLALEANMIAAAKSAGVARIVKLSAMGGRASTFPRLHAEGEDQVKASGIPSTFLRPTGFMQNFIIYSGATIRGQGAIYAALGDAAVSHVDIRDVAAVAVKVLANAAHQGKAYALTGPEALKHSQVAEKLSRAAGRTIQYVDLPPADLRKAMLAAGVPEWTADAELDLQRYYRETRVGEISPVIEQITGRKATTFDQFASDNAAAFRA